MKNLGIAAIASLSICSFAVHADQIKPETFVRFPSSSVACMDRDDLQKVIEHFARGENTKASAMIISKENPSAGCIMLNDKKTFKVLSSEYNDPDHPDMGLLEIVLKGDKSADGAWTLSMFAEQAK